MGMTQSIKKVNYQDVQYVVKNSNYILLNTINKNEQKVLIQGTTPCNNEEEVINTHINNPTNIHIIIYDKNACENRPIEKYDQLMKLGFPNIYIYPGGLFEWLLLQDIYGSDNFPTTSQERDILNYKGLSIFNVFKIRDKL